MLLQKNHINSNQKNCIKFADSIFCTTFAIAISNGALVQLVRIRACHARGQGFESPTHRRCFDSKRLKVQSLFLCIIVLFEQAQQPILNKMGTLAQKKHRRESHDCRLYSEPQKRQINKLCISTTTNTHRRFERTE